VGVGVISNRFFKMDGSKARAALVAVLLSFGSAVGIAGDNHERARQALEAGEILPLRNILERVEREYPGQVVDVELEREHENGPGRWVYEVKVLRSGGTLIKLKIDARDGTITGRKSKDAPAKNQRREDH
jgi:hypothetical protein